MPECAHCGANLPAGATRCPKCGSTPETKEVSTQGMSDSQVAASQEISINIKETPFSTKYCPKCSMPVIMDDVVFLKGKPSAGQYLLAGFLGLGFLVGLINIGDPKTPFQTKISGIILFGLLTAGYLVYILNQYSWICPNCSRRIPMKKWELMSLRERGKIK